MIDFNQWLLISSLLAIIIWALSLPTKTASIGWRLTLLLLPFAASALCLDWLIRQSLSQWLQWLEPFATVLAVGFCTGAILLRSVQSSWSIIGLPLALLLLFFWQLLCLQSGLLSWSFNVQMLLITALFVGLIQIFRIVNSPALKNTLIIIQCIFSWWWFCQWPQLNSHLAVSLVETLISIMSIVALIGVGFLLERLNKLSLKKSNNHESIH